MDVIKTMTGLPIKLGQMIKVWGESKGGEAKVNVGRIGHQST